MVSSQPNIDYAFLGWYLLVVLPSMIAGWWIRGVWERDKAEEWVEMMRDDRWRHPSSNWTMRDEWDARGDEEMEP